MLKMVKVLDIVCLCLLVAAGVLCFYEANELNGKCYDHFEGSLRAQQDADFCDKDDSVPTSVTNCNSKVSQTSPAVYTCTSDGSTTSCSPTGSFVALCLSTHECCSEALISVVMQPYTFR